MPNETSTTIDVTIVARAKHADLYAASKKLGSAAALAKHLGVCYSMLWAWMHLRDYPRRWYYGGMNKDIKMPAKYASEDDWVDLEAKLLVLTGKTLGELFPEALRADREFWKGRRTVEYTRSIDTRMLSGSTEERLVLPSPEEKVIRDEHREIISQEVKCLNKTERDILTLHWGLGNYPQMSLWAIGKLMGLSAERVRQIEGRAIRTLRDRLAQKFSDDFKLEVEEKPDG